MFIAGMVINGIGTVGILIAVAMEWRTREPVWKLLMKVFPWFVGVGMFLMGLSLATRP